MDDGYFIAGGTIGPKAECYVERQADADLLNYLGAGEFCYVLTSRQMGKSSLMVRTTAKLRARQCHVAPLDLTGIGQIVTPDQWYNGILSQLGKRVELEDEVQEHWQRLQRHSPVQRAFDSIRDVILRERQGPLVVFIDEVDAVRSLPFPSDEFFGAIRECYNRRSVDKEYSRLTFCLLGVATPAELIQDARAAPFNIGRRIDLTDFTSAEIAPLAAHLSPDRALGEILLQQVLFWTAGHPYLTQRFCRELVEHERTRPLDGKELVDALCERLFLSSQAREHDPNLLFVRERLLHCEADLTKLLSLYREIFQGQRVADDEANDLVKQLRMAGLVKPEGGPLEVRNRIYRRVFDQTWIDGHLPYAQLEKPSGERFGVKASCTIGRASGNDLVLADPKVSRQHARIQVQRQYQFWLIDLGSSNGTSLNGKRVSQPARLNHGDRLEIGPFRLIFRQHDPRIVSSEPTTSSITQAPG